jgi:hypothetical protein
VLFQHPLSPHAQSIDPLWFSTTYSLIQAYRDAVARIEAALPEGGSGRRGKNGGNGNSDAAADLRRTLARFRTLLGAEDAFYRSLVSRLVAFYRLQDRTREHLALVSISVDDATEHGDDPSLAPPLSREESEKKLAMVYKGLVFVGDLERYKEQYSDRARRELRDGVPRRPRDADRYARAILFYEVARGLQPDFGELCSLALLTPLGQAFNQLAVINQYVGDNFHCTYHYFRALAVRQPFPSGLANLERVLKKTFDQWRSQRHAREEDKEETVDDTSAFKRDLLIILAIQFVHAGTSHLGKLHQSMLERFDTLMRARQLPSEMIVKTTAMVIGSHWNMRFNQSQGESDPKQAERRRAVEAFSLAFLMSVFKTMIRVCADEAEEVLRNTALADDSALATDEDDGEDVTDGAALAQRITAVVRRILPSLRITSRWLKSHLDYLARASTQSPELGHVISDFWQEYKRLMLAFARVFPLAQLPSLIDPLEEDLDMRGFLPLRRRAGADQAVDDNALAASLHEVHPNEEQLMRISDLLVDVKLLIQTEYGSAALNTGTPFPTAPFVVRPSTDEAASISVSTETEDDPVNLAMRATLTEGSSVGDEGGDFDDEEEVILWGRSTPVVPDAKGPQTAQDLMQNLSLAPGTPGGKQPHLLFGGGDTGSGSIWTMSREESQKGASRRAQPHIATLWNDSPSSPQATPTIAASSGWPSQPPPGLQYPQQQPQPQQPQSQQQPSQPHSQQFHPQQLQQFQQHPQHHQPPSGPPSWGYNYGAPSPGPAPHQSSADIWGGPQSAGATWGPPQQPFARPPPGFGPKWPQSQYSGP